MKLTSRKFLIVLILAFINVSCGGNSGENDLTVTTVAGLAYESGSTDGLNSDARFDSPEGITCTGSSLFIADLFNHTIRKINLETGQVSTLAGTAGVSGSTDGTGSTALFYYPRDITNDGVNLYVTDAGNGTIRKIIISSGEVTTLAGTAGVTGGLDGNGSAAQFSGPHGISTDGISLYVAEPGNATIRKISIATGDVVTLAGLAGTIGHVDGVGSAARFTFPEGIATDGVSVFVSDSYISNTIRKIDILTGTVSTIAGTHGSEGFVDGIGPLASFDRPEGMALTGTTLYVADSFNNAIRKINLSTSLVTTIAGDPELSGSTDGSTALASFLMPSGLTIKGQSLFVTNSATNTIREIK